MRRRRKHRRRRHLAPSTSISTYTRPIVISAAGAAQSATVLTAMDVPDVVTPPTETVNRKIIRVTGEMMMACTLSGNEAAFAQFCLRAAPDNQAWPTVAEYDPFTQGPGETGYKGQASPRPFGRHALVFTFAGSSDAGTAIQESHRYSTKAERLLRPGWKLQAGLYIKANEGTVVKVAALLRTVVVG